MRLLRGIFRLLVCLALAVPLTGQTPTVAGGGDYDKLAPEQKALVQKWFEEYHRITGKEINPQRGYNGLRQSVRTTFEAVTHALLKTPLTDPSGKSLGNALSIVKMVESVHGQIPDTRGDEQFRVYVLLADDALDKLYAAVEFKRTGDNSVYHIGYPINFRQQGGTPSIQVSVTRTGLRADIDVDYRSSSGPQALVNGHLTSANSDVRAGSNYFKHIKKWNGFADWWRNLFETPGPIPKEDVQALSSQFTKPRVTAKENVEAAVKDFYESWLVEKKPQQSLAYLSVKANACIAQFGSGESAKQGLIRLRMYEQMKQANQHLGNVTKLDEVMTGTVVTGDGSEPMVQPDGKLFAMSRLTGTTARRLDCRKTMGLKMPESLPTASNGYGQYFASSTLLRDKDSDDAGQLLYQIWAQEEGTWKIVSWYLENPFELAIQAKKHGATGTDIEADAAHTSEAAAAPETNLELANTVDTMLHEWLVKRDLGAVSKYFTLDALSCGKLELGSSKSMALVSPQSLVETWLKEVANAVPQSPKLSEAIQAVEYDANQKVPVQHPHEKTFTLVRISDDLAHMSNCAFRSSGKAVSRTASVGDAKFEMNEYQVLFEPKHTEGDRGAVVLTWALRNGHWRVVAFNIEDY